MEHSSTTHPVEENTCLNGRERELILLFSGIVQHNLLRLEEWDHLKSLCAIRVVAEFARQESLDTSLDGSIDDGGLSGQGISANGRNHCVLTLEGRHQGLFAVVGANDLDVSRELATGL